jgi:hypothetical protein
LCLITAHGEPCGGCVARKTQCKFDLPPLRRHPKSVGIIGGTLGPENTSDMSFTGATHNHLSPGEDPVVNALSALHSNLMGGPFEANLRDSIPSKGTDGSLRQRSDTLMSQGFSSWPGIQNTSTVRELKSPSSTSQSTDVTGPDTR